MAIKRSYGEFCWFDVMTREPEKTKATFTQLLGWSFTQAPIPGGGSLFLAHCNGETIGALHDLANDPRGANIPPHIGLHVMAENVDHTAKAVEVNGGKLIAPVMEIGENGRMCVFQDPTGAVLCCWQPKAQRGMEIDPKVHGAPSWIELLTNDTDRASRFYSQVFGWMPQRHADTPYTTFHMGKTPVAGLLRITAEMGDFPAHWGCYFTVKDVDQMVREAASAGCSVCKAPTTVDQVGRFAILQTSEGICITVIQWTMR